MEISSPPYRYVSPFPRTTVAILLSDCSQDFIARRVAVIVVEGFEVVEINHYKADWGMIAPSISDLCQIGIKLSTVEYSGDRVYELSGLQFGREARR